jgi:hypothetical protein
MAGCDIDGSHTEAGNIKPVRNIRTPQIHGDPVSHMQQERHRGKPLPPVVKAVDLLQRIGPASFTDCRNVKNLNIRRKLRGKIDVLIPQDGARNRNDYYHY